MRKILKRLHPKNIAKFYHEDEEPEFNILGPSDSPYSLDPYSDQVILCVEIDGGRWEIPLSEVKVDG